MMKFMIIVMLLVLSIIPMDATTYTLGNHTIDMIIPEPNKQLYAENDVLYFNTLEGKCGMLEVSNNRPLYDYLMKDEIIIEESKNMIITVSPDQQFAAHIPGFAIWSDMNLSESMKFFKSVSVGNIGHT